RQVGAADREPGAVLQPVHIRDGPPASARALPVLADAQGEARGGAVMAVATEHGPRVLSRRGALPLDVLPRLKAGDSYAARSCGQVRSAGSCFDGDSARQAEPHGSIRLTSD